MRETAFNIFVNLDVLSCNMYKYFSVVLRFLGKIIRDLGTVSVVRYNWRLAMSRRWLRAIPMSLHYSLTLSRL
jgi:hypothetical protein